MINFQFPRLYLADTHSEVCFVVKIKIATRYISAIIDCLATVKFATVDS